MTDKQGKPSQQTAEKGRILIVDDEVELTSALSEMLARQGFYAQGVNNGPAALAWFDREPFDIVLADLMMPDMDGISLIKRLMEMDPNLIPIIMTGQGTVQTAIEAMKVGAFDYLLKPFKVNTVLTTLNRSLEVRRLRMDNVHLREMVNIHELGQNLSVTLNIEEILSRISKAALQQIQADEVSILVPSGVNRHMNVAAAAGTRADRANLVGKEVPLEGTISGWVAENLRPLTLQGKVDDSRFPAGFPRAEIRSSISMPMVSGNSLVGVLNVNITSRPHELTPGQIRGLTILVGIAASALENARLYEQTEKRLSRLTALRTIDLAIASSTDIRLALNIILDQSTTQLEGDAASIFLFNPQSQLLEFAAGRGLRGRVFENADLSLGEGYAGASALEQRMVRILDLPSADPDPFRDRLVAEEGFHTCFIMPLVALGEVEGVLEIFHRTSYTPDKEWLDYFEALAGQAAIAINSARLLEGLKDSNQQLLMAYNTTIEGWSRALDLRDHETEGHTQRVTETTLRLVRAIGGFTDDEILQIRRGCLLHDIGKMGVPDHILLKPDKLTDEEWTVMRKHPELAYQLLSPIPYLRKALDIPFCHHEHWDGSGYPRGLKGEQIPIAARIFSVVDVWDALSCDRPYRACWPHKQVVDYIQERSGTQFDPAVVEVFLRVVEGEKECG